MIHFRSPKAFYGFTALMGAMAVMLAGLSINSLTVAHYEASIYASLTAGSTSLLAQSDSVGVPLGSVSENSRIALAAPVPISFASDGTEPFEIIRWGTPPSGYNNDYGTFTVNVATPVGTKGNATVIGQAKDWAAPMPGSSWISYKKNTNQNGKGPVNGAVIRFRKNFTVSDANSVGVVAVLVDDNATVYLDGKKIDKTATGVAGAYREPSYFALPPMSKGRHFLWFEVAQNDKANNQTFGLDFTGTVIGPAAALTQTVDPGTANVKLASMQLLGMNQVQKLKYLIVSIARPSGSWGTRGGAFASLANMRLVDDISGQTLATIPTLTSGAEANQCEYAGNAISCRFGSPKKPLDAQLVSVPLGTPRTVSLYADLTSVIAPGAINVGFYTGNRNIAVLSEKSAAALSTPFMVGGIVTVRGTSNGDNSTGSSVPTQCLQYQKSSPETFDDCVSNPSAYGSVTPTPPAGSTPVVTPSQGSSGAPVTTPPVPAQCVQYQRISPETFDDCIDNPSAYGAMTTPAPTPAPVPTPSANVPTPVSPKPTVPMQCAQYQMTSPETFDDCLSNPSAYGTVSTSPVTSSIPTQVAPTPTPAPKTANVTISNAGGQASKLAPTASGIEVLRFKIANDAGDVVRISGLSFTENVSGVDAPSDIFIGYSLYENGARVSPVVTSAGNGRTNRIVFSFATPLTLAKSSSRTFVLKTSVIPAPQFGSRAVFTINAQSDVVATAKESSTTLHLDGSATSPVQQIDALKVGINGAALAPTTARVRSVNDAVAAITITAPNAKTPFNKVTFLLSGDALGSSFPVSLKTDRGQSVGAAASQVCAPDQTGACKVTFTPNLTMSANQMLSLRLIVDSSNFNNSARVSEKLNVAIAGAGDIDFGSGFTTSLTGLTTVAQVSYQ